MVDGEEGTTAGSKSTREGPGADSRWLLLRKERL